MVAIMSPEEIKKIAKEGGHEAIKEFFIFLGVDIDSADSLKDFQSDLSFMRRQRKGAEQAGIYFRWAFITTFVSALGWLLFEGVKHALGK